MRLMEDLVTASTLFILAATSPIDLQPRAGNFIIHQKVPKPFQKSGPAAMLSTYGKYNASAPEEVVKAAYANNGWVSAAPIPEDREYLSPVVIGGQTLNMNFDTGSSDLWVFCSNLPDSQTTGHSVYNPALSSTSIALREYTWDISYKDHSWANGTVGTDTVRIGSTTVTGQAVQLANEISPSFERDIESDGLVGLGFDTSNTVQPVSQKTFFSNAKVSLSAPLFTANLRKGKPGSYTFGYINAEEHTGSITYVPVNSNNGHWEFRSKGFAVGNAAFRSYSFRAIADTGTTLALLPDTIVRAYYRYVVDSGYNYAQAGWTFPCSAELPTFSIGIGNYQATVPGSYIRHRVVEDTNGEICYGGIQSNDGFSKAILGDTFLKSQFVVFQSSPLQLGFAPKPL